ncbi:MAG: DUF2007 domain-containing protein [Capsulimonas sp.]|uniref:putative signal transducing protein n=1 Tax=Capsulimonas sp. TaxID=2494211 RepID=UPI0032673F56
MIKVFTAPNIMDVEILRAELESRGIETMLNHEFLRSQTTLSGFGDVWPELWVVKESDASAAQQITASRNDPPTASDWTCPQCGEDVAGQFTSCWSCGHDRPVSG